MTSGRAPERVNADLKDYQSDRSVRARGHAKMTCHLMLAILSIAATQVLRLVT